MDTHTPQKEKRSFTIPGSSAIGRAYARASFGEKSIAGIFALIFAGSALALLFQINASLTTTVPTHGGTLHEGIVGAPRFINPLLAASDADRDLTELVYAGLLTPTPDGGFTEELAETYTISEDGLTYTFVIRDDALFHDGESVTADDVLFTITKAQDSSLKSPKRPNWEGVLVEKIDEKTIQFTLNQPYALFLENATLGILPKHIWDTATSEQFAFSQFNLEPIGSGPYKVTDVDRNKAGIPQTYTLSSWDKYTLGRPYISRMVLHFYPNEEQLREAYAKGTIQAMSAIAPTYARELEGNTRIETHPLPRVFGVFFNQSKAALFTHREVRRALQDSIPVQELIDTVLSGYGTPTSGPLPPSPSDEPITTTYTPESAHILLEENGWARSEDGIYEKAGQRLAFTLSTANTPELKESADFLEQQWREFGVDVTVELFDIGALNQDNIRPRNFDALLFGQIIGRTPDPFAFWHSSQRNDPGLNIALYANITVDDILEEIRVEQDSEVRQALYKEFAEEVQADQPAVFLYAPDFIYVLPEAIHGVELGTVTTPAERFLAIHQWYMRTDKIWNIFIK